MAAQHAARYSERESRRHLPSLPSIKELNFSYRPPPQEASPQTHTILEAAVVQERHSQQWARAPVPPAHPVHVHQAQPQQQQHTPPLSAGHAISPKVMEYTPKHDSAGYLTPGVPLSAQVTPVPGSVTTGARADEVQSQPKRSRNASSSSINVVREVRPIHNYPGYHPYPPQPPPSPFHQVPPSPHEQMNHHQSPISPHPGYPGYAQHYPPRPSHGPPPMPHQAPHSNPYPTPAPPPPAQNHWEHQPPPMQPQHHHSAPPPAQGIPPQETYINQTQAIQQHPLEQVPYSRTSSLMPPPVDTRPPQYNLEELPQLSPRASTMSEIVKLCSLLYSFAMRYAQADAQPNPTELAEMAQKANEVVRLLEELRQMYSPDIQGTKPDSLNLATPDDHRPPKRPWEEMSKEGLNGTSEVHEQSGAADQSQSTAEQDMEIIRTKRATTSIGGSSTAGQPKSKYRKRSRATPPGKCHSCNIRETPEWRRGPDGARTLCNACGLHYAKLMRKRIQLNPGAPPPHIDMEMLRATARAAEQDKAKSSRQTQSVEPLSPLEQANPEPPKQPLPAPVPQHQHHQGAFQVVTMIPGPEPSSLQQISPASGPPPTSWSSNVGMTGRGFNRKSSDSIQHQSFLRTSQGSPR